MLNGEEHSLAVGREAGTAQFGADGRAEEEARQAPLYAIGLDRVEAIGLAGLGPVLPLIGRHPQAALRIDRAIVG